MKNNRQIGLDGRIFVSTAIHRGAFFVFMLMLYGIVTAFADILKLTGESGVAMGAFTTTLLIYDFVVSLMLVVVVFYAYFLECGADVPVIKEKPLMIFGYFRLGYYVLLAYYICYRMLYCFANTDTVSVYIGIFYAVYLALIALLIMANCYIFNTIARNIIRRSYEKSLHHLAIAGLVVQALMPIAYILARANMDNIGDEYFTSAFCDLLRLFVAPILMSSLWFLFLHAVGQVHDVYSEVDTALRGKNYQITYSAESTGRASRKKGQPEAPASAVLLPAGYTAPTNTAAPRALLSGAAPVKPAKTSEPAAPSAPAPAQSEETEQEPIVESIAQAAAEPETVTDTTETAAEAAPETAPEAADDTSEDEIITAFAEEARKAVAMTAAQQEQQKKKSQPQPPHKSKVTPKQSTGKKQNQPARNTAAQMQQPLPVQEFDPYPAASVPHKPQHIQPTPQQKAAYPARNGNQKNRPANIGHPGGRPQQAQNGRPQQTGAVRQPQPSAGRPQQPQRGGNQPRPQNGHNAAGRPNQKNSNGRQR